METKTQTVFPFDRLLSLPEVSEGKKSNLKRALKVPDLSLLKDEQLRAFEDMASFMEGEGRMHLLEGYAGTGKTFTISTLIEYLMTSKGARRPKIALTAPTNKAVKVQKEMAPYSDDSLEYRTIHSLLGLKEHIDGYGRVSYKKNKGEASKLLEYDLIIVDEVSMLADELFNYIHEEQKMYRQIKVIFVGDPCQIPPVGNSESIPLDEKKRASYGIGRSVLSTVVRQAAGNPIIAISMEIRERIHRHKSYVLSEHSFSDNLDGVYFIGSDLKSEFYTILEKYFDSENFKQDSNFCKVVAWTNRVVDLFNNHIRKLIFKEEKLSKIMVGEKLIADAPIFEEFSDSTRPIFNTNDEIVIRDVSLGSDVFRGIELKFYIASVKHSGGDLFSHSAIKKIRILHEDSEEAYNEILKNLVEVAKGAQQGGWEAAEKWKAFYSFQGIFSQVKYNYAITAHKSQGSTYENVFVFESDIDKNRTVIDRNRIKYTAFTRASSKLFILN